MASTAMKFIILLVSLAIGIGITIFGTSLIPDIDQQTQIIIAIVLTLSAYISFYFMTKGSGSG